MFSILVLVLLFRLMFSNHDPSLVHLEITSEVHGAEKPPTRRSPAGVEALVAKLRYQVVFAHLARHCLISMMMSLKMF